jgi:hypothetical protein
MRPFPGRGHRGLGLTGDKRPRLLWGLTGYAVCAYSALACCSDCGVVGGHRSGLGLGLPGSIFKRLGWSLRRGTGSFFDEGAWCSREVVFDMRVEGLFGAGWCRI